MRASGPDMAAKLTALERENRGASAGQRDPAPKRPADHLRVFAARSLHESLGLAAAHSTPDEERFVAGFRPDMTVVKARQDFLSHERHYTQGACNHGIGTKSSNRGWFKRCKYRSDSPKPWMCSTAASTAQLSTTYALRQHPGSLLTSACRPWKNWPTSRTLRSAHHAARRCVNCAGREPNPSRFADTAALSVKTVEKNEARSRCTNIPTGARP